MAYRTLTIAVCVALMSLLGSFGAADSRAEKGPAETEPLDREFSLVSSFIFDGSESQAIKVLKEHPDLAKYRHPRAGTLLNAAAARGRAKVAEHLIRRGADPNESVDGRTPLHICILFCTTGLETPDQGFRPIDYSEIFDLLLRKGADPKKCEIVGGEPFATSNPGEIVLIPSEEPLLSLGVKLQILQGYTPNTQARNVLLARLRDYMGLPVDALLPLNAESLYADAYRGDHLPYIVIPANR